MSTETNDRSVRDRVFAVVGATGQQGGATARALLTSGTRVRALVRDLQSAPAQALSQQGAQLVRADLGDAASVRAAFTGVDGVFAMTTFATARGTEGEVEHGTVIAEAALQAGVSHVVYSSVGGAERHTGIPHFESKRRVEEHLESLDLYTTFVRPTFFMENFVNFFAPRVENDAVVLRLPLPAGVPLQMIATTDVGEVATAALLDPTRVVGGSIEIAGDELTVEQIATVYGEHLGLPTRYEPIPLNVLEDSPDQEAMFAWLSRLPAYQADFAATRNLAPSVRDSPPGCILGSVTLLTCSNQKIQAPPTRRRSSKMTDNSGASSQPAPIPPDDTQRSLVIARPDMDQNLLHVGLVGDTYTILLKGEDTAGRYTLIDMHVPQGGGPPPHRHDFEEMFHVLEGEIEITFRGEKSTVRVGETLNIPANAPHSFTNASARPARLLCMCSPSGQEEFFMEVGVPVATRTATPPELDEADQAAFVAKAQELAPKYRTELLGQ